MRNERLKSADSESDGNGDRSSKKGKEEVLKVNRFWHFFNFSIDSFRIFFDISKRFSLDSEKVSSTGVDLLPLVDEIV